MSSETFSCPECRATLQYAQGLEAGAQVRCPKCQAQFAVPDRMSPPGPGPSDDQYTDAPGRGRPSMSPPPAEEYSPTRRPARPGGPDDYPDEDYPERPLSGDYSIDLGRWFNVAGQHYSAVLGPSIGFILLALLLTLVVYFAVGGAAGFIAYAAAGHDPAVMVLMLTVLMWAAMLVVGSAVLYPLYNGIFAVYLAQVKGRPWSFGDFFAGFQRFAPLATVGFLSILLGIVLSIPSLAITFVGEQNNDQNLRMLGQLVNLAGVVVSIFFQVRLFLFAPIIVFDRNLTAMDAIKANWELTRGHFWGLFGVSLLLGLINLGGAIACLIGLLFAIPYTMLILTGGYVIISGRRGPADYSFRGEE